MSSKGDLQCTLRYHYPSASGTSQGQWPGNACHLAFRVCTRSCLLRSYVEQCQNSSTQAMSYTPLLGILVLPYPEFCSASRGWRHSWGHHTERESQLNHLRCTSYSCDWCRACRASILAWHHVCICPWNGAPHTGP